MVIEASSLNRTSSGATFSEHTTNQIRIFPGKFPSFPSVRFASSLFSNGRHPTIMFTIVDTRQDQTFFIDKERLSFCFIFAEFFPLSVVFIVQYRLKSYLFCGPSFEDRCLRILIKHLRKTTCPFRQETIWSFVCAPSCELFCDNRRMIFMSVCRIIVSGCSVSHRTAFKSSKVFFVVCSVWYLERTRVCRDLRFSWFSVAMNSLTSLHLKRRDWDAHFKKQSCSVRWSRAEMSPKCTSSSTSSVRPDGIFVDLSSPWKSTRKFSFSTNEKINKTKLKKRISTWVEKRRDRPLMKNVCWWNDGHWK